MTFATFILENVLIQNWLRGPVVCMKFTDVTPWCRVFLEKLTGLQLVKKFPAFYGTQRFITAFTSFRHPSLSWASPIQSTTHLLQIHLNIIHPSTPRSPQRSLPLRFPHQDPIRPPLLPHPSYMPSPSHSSRFYHPQCVRFLLTVFEEGAGNAFLKLADMRNLQPAHSLLVKLKMPHSPSFQFVFIMYTVSFNMPEKNVMHVFRSGEWGGQNPLLIFLLQKKSHKQCIVYSIFITNSCTY